MTKQKVVVADAKSGVAELFMAEVKKPRLTPVISKKNVLQNLEINGGMKMNSWVESMRASSPTSSRKLINDQTKWMVCV